LWRFDFLPKVKQRCKRCRSGGFLRHREETIAD
jgi:hypothetical protein